MLDALDWKIMAELQEDGRRPYREISRRLGISPGTVRLRALQLMEDGFLQVIAVPNSWRLGYLFQAVVGLKLDPGQADTVADILVERPEVGWVGLTTSRFDVLFEVMLEDGRQFGSYKEEFLGRLPGCRDIEVFEVWDVKKFNYELASIPEALGQLFASNATTLENDRTSRQQLGRTVGGRHLPPQPPAKAAP